MDDFMLAKGPPSGLKWVSAVRASGLMWMNVGKVKPKQGRELGNKELSAFLASKTELTPTDWEVFGINDLRHDDFIRVEDSFFQPTGNDLANTELADALARKTEKNGTLEFTQEEWSAFGIENLSDDDFVKSGERYFKPAGHRRVSFRLTIVEVKTTL